LWLGAGREKAAERHVIHAERRGASGARDIVIAGHPEQQGAPGLGGQGFPVAIVPHINMTCWLNSI
jgi:hypothetical protein